MTDEDKLWKIIGKMAGDNPSVATYVLHGSSVPLFPILKENDGTKAMIICTPEYMERIKKDLDVR